MSTRSPTRHESEREASQMPANALTLLMDLPRRQLALMFALQSDLMRFNLLEAAQCWNQLANSALKWQADMVSRAGEAVIESTTEPTLESLQRAFEVSLNGRGAAGRAASAMTH